LATDALTVSDIDAFYGDSHVLQDVSFELGEARMLGLLGRNGAGKSTCMNVAVGLLPPRQGRVSVFGENVTGKSPENVAAWGVALVPQGRRIFKSLTVKENLEVAAKPPVDGKHALWSLETVFAMFPRLKERASQMAAHLSGGEQQMLAIGRALMTNPDCLIMDEPSEGLAPIIIQGLWEAIGTLKKEGLSILLVEQNAHLALKLVDYVHVMSKGQVVYSAKPDELRANDEIKSSYLGI